MSTRLKLSKLNVFTSTLIFITFTSLMLFSVHSAAEDNFSARTDELDISHDEVYGEYECPNQSPALINQVATDKLRTYYKADQALPSIIPMPFQFESYLNKDWTVNFYGYAEMFVRPKKGRIGLLNMTDDTLVYGCVQIHPQDISKTKLIIYFMKGNHMDPGFLNNLFFWESVSVKVSASNIITGGDGLIGLLQGVFNKIPVVSQSLKFLDLTLGNLTGLVFKQFFQPFFNVGIERIIVTSEYIEISAGVDALLLLKPRIHKRIKLDKNPFPKSFLPIP